MKIEIKEYEEIQVISDSGELLVSITDENFIEKDGYKVVCVPITRAELGITMTIGMQEDKQ